MLSGGAGSVAQPAIHEKSELGHGDQVGDAVGPTGEPGQHLLVVGLHLESEDLGALGVGFGAEHEFDGVFLASGEGGGGEHLVGDVRLEEIDQHEDLVVILTGAVLAPESFFAVDERSLSTGDPHFETEAAVDRGNALAHEVEPRPANLGDRGSGDEDGTLVVAASRVDQTFLGLVPEAEDEAARGQVLCLDASHIPLPRKSNPKRAISQAVILNGYAGCIDAFS